MQHEVRLPSLGEDSAEEATVAYWLVEEGDHVDEGDDLVEMATDKAAFGVPSPTSGTLVELCVGEGDEVGVNDVLCIIETEA